MARAIHPAVDIGAVVLAQDGRLGVVEEVVDSGTGGSPTSLRVRADGDQRRLSVPWEWVEGTPSRDRVQLRVPTEQVLAHGARSANAGAAGTESEVLRVPIVEEHLRADVTTVDIGELRIHKTIEERPQIIRQPLTRDDVTVDRVVVERFVDRVPEPRQEGDVYIVPVVEEVLVYQKRLFQTEELHIRRRQITHVQEVRETVRRLHVDVENTTSPPDATPSRLDAAR